MQPLSPHAAQVDDRRRRRAGARRPARGADLLAAPSPVRAVGAAEPDRARIRPPGAATRHAHRAVRRRRRAGRARGRHPPALRLPQSPLSRRRRRSLGRGRPGAVLRGQCPEQGVRRVRRACQRHSEHCRGRARPADPRRHRHGGAGQPAVRRIPARLDSRPPSMSPAPSWCCAFATSRPRRRP